jgi:hypothetical protein
MLAFPHTFYDSSNGDDSLTLKKKYTYCDACDGLKSGDESA